MSTCDSYQVYGLVESRRTLDGVRHLVLSLKPSTELREELCGFCDQHWNSDSDLQSRTSKHSHSLKGSFFFIPSENQLTFTLTERREDPVEAPAAVIDTQEHAGVGGRVDEQVNQGVVEDTLHYEVDGNMFEIQRHKGVGPPQDQTSYTGCPTPRAQEMMPKKTIELLIDEKMYSTTVIADRAYSESCEADGEAKTASEGVAELPQVKFMEKSIIPEVIRCGPDTTTFLNNMKELAKLVTPAGQNTFRCEQCTEQMTSYFAYIEHVFKHLGTRPYVCTVCQSSFQTRACTRHHLDMHGGKAPFECEFCFKKFRNSSHMKQHRMRHTGEKPHPCPYCDKSFAHKNVLKIHLQTHTGEKPCCCDLCGKLFREPHRLAVHLETHYRSSKGLECSTCGKVFKLKGMLKLHEAKHCKPSTDDGGTEEKMLETLQNAAFTEAIDEDNLLGGDQTDVTIIEAETLEDGTMVLPVNTYIVEPSSAGGGAMLVQFSIDQSDVQVIASLEKELGE